MLTEAASFLQAGIVKVWKNSHCRIGFPCDILATIKKSVKEGRGIEIVFSCLVRKWARHLFGDGEAFLQEHFEDVWVINEITPGNLSSL